MLQLTKTNMKIFIILFFLIGTVIFNSCSKEESNKKYYPFIAQDKIWTYAHFDFEIDSITGDYKLSDCRYRKIGRDTIIDGEKWYFVYLSTDEFHENWVVSGMILEENKKVYIGSDKSILYDFSAEVGDTLQLYGVNLMAVDSIKYLALLDGEERKHIYLTRNSLPWPTIWIEGIGSLHGFFGANYGAITKLVSYEEKCELIYQDTTFDYNTCFFEDTTKNIK